MISKNDILFSSGLIGVAFALGGWFAHVFIMCAISLIIFFVVHDSSSGSPAAHHKDEYLGLLTLLFLGLLMSQMLGLMLLNNFLQKGGL